MQIDFRRVATAILSALMLATPVLSLAATEVRMTAEMLADFELDSARDGNNCPTCNFGAGNARVAYVDTQFRVMVAPLDISTGMLLTNLAVVVDTNAAFVTDYGNGPSWMFSQRGSELVYTRYLNGRPRRDGSAGMGMAQQVGPDRWQAGFIAGSLGRVNPKATTVETDAVPRISYGDVKAPLAYWRMAQSNAQESVLPGDGSNRGVGLRWVPGSPEIIYSYTAPGETDDQIFVYNTATSLTEQITTGPGYKRAQFMLYAPEFGGQAVAFMVVDDTRFDLYTRVTDPDGARRWVKFNTIDMPAAMAYVSGSPEAFVHNGRTWILLALRKSLGLNAPSNLALLSLDPSRPELRMLTDATNPSRWRSDPEYFIGQDTVYIYYTRALPWKFPTVGEGVWRVDTGLGPLLPR